MTSKFRPCKQRIPTLIPVNDTRLWLMAWLFIGLTFGTLGTGYCQSPADTDPAATMQEFSTTRDRFRTPRNLPYWRTPTEVMRFRSIDGSMNNLVGIFWGSAGGNLRRRVPNAYGDGLSLPAGANRKPARSVSNYLCNQNQFDLPNRRGMSSMVWQWGQFLDHDITLTEIAEPEEALPIVVPTPDRYFDPFGLGGQTIPFFRSHYRTGMAADVPREQINSITSWIDASNVYGSDDPTARSLRELAGGRMRTSNGDMLPIGDDGFFLAGDVRANEQVCLTALHTIFVREHNRKADEIACKYPWLSDQQIYVRARKHVGALMQVITYNEFLPALMGREPLSPYQGYHPLVFPNVSNTFATAAYRFGHSMLPTDVWRLDNDGRKIKAGHLSLHEAFFNPANLTKFGIDPYLKGLTEQTSQEIDLKVVGDLRNFLFGPPGSGGFDLAALNIQRGRDHGLADFNSIRRFYRLKPYQSFAQISSTPEVRRNLALAYDSVDNIDPWVGILAEDHLPGASVGPTLFHIMKQQFEMLRDADRFWYERDFHEHELEELRWTTLADVIERNSGVRNLRCNVFFVSE